MKPTLRQYEYVLALKREGSFSKAAAACYVTQSTLSAGIKELETILGQQIVARNARDIRFTPFGEAVLDIARQSMDLTEALLVKAQRQTAPLTGSLKLGIIPTIAPYMLPAMIPVLRKDYPDLDLNITEDLTDRLLERLHKGEIDLVLMAFPYPLSGCEARVLYEEEFQLVLAKNDPFSKRTIGVKDLDGMQILLLEDGHCLRDHAIQACKLQSPPLSSSSSSSSAASAASTAASASPSNGVRATSVMTLVEMVSQGMGVTLLPKMAAQKLDPAALKTIEFKGKKPVREIGLVWRKNAPQAADYNLFGDIITKLQNF